VLSVVLLLAVLSSDVAAVLFFSHTPAPSQQTAIVGHAFFVSSGLISNESNQGITDKLQIDVQHIPDPQPEKKYYAWLLSSKSQTDFPALALGSLSVHQGRATMTYNGALHTNLLANYNRFLVSERVASQQATNPSLEIHSWQYYDAFSTTRSPTDTKDYSLYDHLQHLLSQDPKLKAAGLTGGLDTWLFKNTTKILEAAGSARDAHEGCTSAPNNGTCAFIHRALVRVLDYLDGSNYVQADVPMDTPLYIDPTIARVAMLEFDVVHQQPPGYLRHIGTHLREITISPGVTPEQRTLAIRITQAIDNVQGWLVAVHTDAVKLEKMDNGQMSQAAALSILDDLFTQANHAFLGQFDPNTSTVKEGVVQIHNNIQKLATFDVTPCTINNGKQACS